MCRSYGSKGWGPVPPSVASQRLYRTTRARAALAPLPSWAVLDQGDGAPRRRARRAHAGRAALGPTRRGAAGRRVGIVSSIGPAQPRSRYCCGMSSAFVQTLIGTLAAVVGGLGAALWQTAHADDVARRIRRAERHEEALIDLNALVTEIYGQLLSLYRQAEHGQSAAQHNQARQALDTIAQHWDSRSSSIISDPPIVDAYTHFNVAVQEGLSATGTLQRVRELSAGDEAAGRRFLRDLGRVVGTLDELRKAVREQVELLDSEPSQRRASVWLRKVRVLVRKRQPQRLPGH